MDHRLLFPVTAHHGQPQFFPEAVHVHESRFLQPAEVLSPIPQTKAARMRCWAAGGAYNVYFGCYLFVSWPCSWSPLPTGDPPADYDIPAAFPPARGARGPPVRGHAAAPTRLHSVDLLVQLSAAPPKTVQRLRTNHHLKPLSSQSIDPIRLSVIGNNSGDSASHRAPPRLQQL